MKNVKKVRRSAWVCIFLCILYLGYAFYDIMCREHNLSSLSLKFIYCAEGVLNIILCGFILVFLVKILSKIKSGFLFVPNNHVWLYCAALCSFIRPVFMELWRLRIRNLGFEWHFVLDVIFKPIPVMFMISGMLLLIFAWLYKIGENMVEDHRLTI